MAQPFPGNSDKAKEQGIVPPTAPKPRPKMTPIVEGSVTVKKKGLASKFKETFFGGDAKGAVAYMVTGVMVPALKSMIVDSAQKGVEKMIYGDKAPLRGPGTVQRPHFTYNAPVWRGGMQAPASSMLPGQPPHQIPVRPNSTHQYLFSNREDADRVLETLGAACEQYDVVAVSDLYDLMGMPHNHIDTKWGWTTMAQSQIQQARDGYLLLLPPAVELN